MSARAKKIVKAIITDMRDRRGLGDEWEQCDRDVQVEIRETWADLIDLVLGMEDAPIVPPATQLGGVK